MVSHSLAQLKLFATCYKYVFILNIFLWNINKIFSTSNFQDFSPVKLFHYFCQYLTGTQNISHIKISIRKVFKVENVFNSSCLKTKLMTEAWQRFYLSYFFLFVSQVGSKITKICSYVKTKTDMSISNWRRKCHSYWNVLA